ncbi:MAG: hypothetical protein Q7W02_03285 [Candidatus Rokubacteria bacterium]|nr:hypothetical protein [Candidatus Rokubacteria bacterium]
MRPEVRDRGFGERMLQYAKAADLEIARHRSREPKAGRVFGGN